MSHTQDNSTNRDNMKQSELLNIQTNAQGKENKSNWGNGEESNADKIIERKRIEGTPFTIISAEGKGYRTVMGKWQITEKFETEKELLKWMEENYYTVILTMIIVVNDDIKNKQEEKEIYKVVEDTNDYEDRV